MATFTSGSRRGWGCDSSALLDCLALERRRRWLQGIGHGRPQASNDHDEGARKALSKRRFAHPSPPSDAVCAVVRGGVSVLQSQHFRRRMCIKKRTDTEIMKPTDRLQGVLSYGLDRGQRCTIIKALDRNKTFRVEASDFPIYIRIGQKHPEN
jgi:hypothetical protein